MKITIAKDYKELSELAAGLVADTVKNCKNAVLGLPTGSTPVGMYNELSKACQNKDISFKDAVTFNLDEYIGLSKTNENSYFYFMNENLYSKVDLDINNVNIPNGNADNIEEECKRYEEKIRLAGGMDIIVLGIGKNGHIGFNEPEDYFEPYTHKVDLKTSTIDANSRFFEDVDQVPKSAVTMGIKTILSAKCIVLIVSGKEKAPILKETIEGKITPQVPASILQLHNNIHIIADSEAAAHLQ